MPVPAAVPAPESPRVRPLTLHTDAGAPLDCVLVTRADAGRIRLTLRPLVTAEQAVRP